MEGEREGPMPSPIKPTSTDGLAVPAGLNMGFPGEIMGVSDLSIVIFMEVAASQQLHQGLI
jgi:hypothetical protein